MTTTQHTPGPWKLSNPKQPCNGYVTTQAVNGVVQHIASFYNSPCGYDEANANANLIAAAPDLLAALKEVLKSLKNDIFDWPTYSEDDERLLAWLKDEFTEVETRIKTAITKAEGEG